MDSLETACHAAAASGGIAVLPAFIADPVPQLRRVFPDPVSSNVGWIVYHDCVRDASRVRVVADALLSFLQSREALFSGVR